MSEAHALFAGIVDFAGTYPPASLSPAAAVAEYRRAVASEDAWLLGRLVWPAARLDVLDGLLAADPPHIPWRVSAVAGPEWGADLDRVRGMRSTSFVVDAFEAKVGDAAEAASLAARLPADVTGYAEIPPTPDPDALLAALPAAGLHAKLRTGGVTADAFPRAEDIARFLARCVARDVQLKATAGLHHVVRGEYPLTYEPGCARGTMYGFLNLLAAVWRIELGDSEGARAALETTSPAMPAPADAASVRRRLHSFGSCSFREPAAELADLGVLT